MTAAELIALLQQLPPDREIASEDDDGLMTDIGIGEDGAVDERFPGRKFFVLIFGHEKDTTC